MNINNKYIHTSLPIPTNSSLSSASSQSTDESSSSTTATGKNLANRFRTLHQMISLKNSANQKLSLFRSFEVPHEHYPIIIHFLDDTERTFYMNRSSKGIDLLKEVYEFLNLSIDKKYFGLLIEDLIQDFSYRWLDLTKSLKKQLIINQSLSCHLYFKVRFFLLNPSSQIDDEYTKYLYVLQIKKELLSGKMWCPRSIAAILGSYIVQSELGDYNVNQHQHGYLNDFRFVPFQNSDFENEVHQYHTQHTGQSPADAESNYLNVASTLDMYGVELHKTSVKVTDISNSITNSTVELYVGVCAIGICIFQNSTKINIFSWDQITKISFKRRTFYVQLVKKLNCSDDNLIVFTLRNYHACKYLWKSCVDHHTFFRLTSFKKSLNEKKTNSFKRISHRRDIRSSTLPIVSNNKNSISFHLPLNGSLSYLDKPLQSPPPKPPRQPLIENVLLHKTDYQNRLQMPVENIFLNSSNSLLIKLQPDTNGRYGFNIKRGDNEQTPTIISKVVLNTPASRALLRQGDIVLSINDIDIRNHTHEEIINMIRHSRKLELLIKCIDKKKLLEESLKNIRHDLLEDEFIEQYENLSRRKDGFTFEIANNQMNIYNNRYKDVLPYDQTRVILQTDPDNDYINASYINMPIISTDIINRYIATQGPLPSTCEAFWRMMWEQKCSLIIMLTTLYENGRIKCHQYWPNILETNDYNIFTIHCCRERKENDLIYREFILINKQVNEERIIYQIQNETWPDHGVPNDYLSFVNFVLEIRELRKANKHLPILVHCSAGIGRTGVIILMETALCLIEAYEPVYPLDIVREMREQRLGMIQTISQYQFACEAVLYAYDQGLIEFNGNN